MVSIFVAGLLSSFHCVGMCGPLLVVHASLVGRSGIVIRQTMLHLGRMVTYVFLGCVAGAVGIMIGHGGELAGIQAGASLAGGAMMVLMAGGLLGHTAFSRFVVPIDPRKVVRRVNALLVRSGLLGHFVLGLYWGFLPCCLVWAFAVRALGSGSPVQGALVMLVFAASTLPVLFLTTLAVLRLPARFRRVMDRLAAGAVLVIGLLLLARGAAYNGWIPHLWITDYVILF